jgi:hypothetical protein
MARETPVFISYARADERYATELMRRLAQEPDIAPWQDRISMSPGDFEEQIRAGIDSADYFVLVMTPAALQSPWVEKEWRYARTNGHCVVPITPTLDSPEQEAELAARRAGLPLWMRNIQTYDFDRYWKRFVAVLQSPCQATRSPFQVPALPANVVRRPAEFDRTLDAILDDARQNPSGRTVVLHGTGGFGKTTLALSVCYDRDVFAACDGGIICVTLGQHPSIKIQLELIYTALTNQRPAFNSDDDAMFEVARKLEGKRCLLVIDDVWRLQDLKPFLHSASTTRLITTRILNVAINVAPDQRCLIDIGEPSPEQAEQMLSARLSVPAASAPRLKELAERLHRVPLLLQLANRCLFQLVAKRLTVDDALDWALQQYLDLGVVAFDERHPSGPEDAVRQTIEVSLSFLGDERERCLELGVLRGGTDIPFSVLGTLWGEGETQAQATAQRLDDFGLIALNLPARTIRLHDYVREYLGLVLPDRARVHGRLVEAWTRPRPPAGYPVQQIVFHLVESMTDSEQIVQRASQLVALLENPGFQRYQREHGDAAALHRQLTAAIGSALEKTAPQMPALVASLVLLRKGYAARARDAALVFQKAAAGRLDEAAELLALFKMDPHWATLARLLIAWVAPAGRAAEARVFVDEAARDCDSPRLQAVLAWVRQPAGGVPAGLQPIEAAPELWYVSAVLQRAGGSEAIEGLEPLKTDELISGTDATGFIADRDGPALVAFARLDPDANTQYLERYVDIHAANRYAYYRSRSLWTLLQPILQFPDPAWVRRLVQRIVTAAINGARVDFEGFLPLAVRGLRAHEGDMAASAELEGVRQELQLTAATLRPEEGRTDSWSHHQRRAAALAEVWAIALDRRSDAADLLALARALPKGFAGFRAPSALMLAESTRIAAPEDDGACAAALTSAVAASHRIQDHRFCLQVTAIVNAIRLRWSDMPAIDLQATVDRFLDNPLAAEFCAVHLALEQFEYRAEDQQYFQALPIPEPVRQARTLGQIAAIFECEPAALVAVNEASWAEADAVLTEVLEKGREINIPDPEFVPILSARFAAQALVADGLPRAARTRIIQRLVRPALPNPTAVDTVLGRLVLSLEGAAHLPPLLRNLELPDLVVAGSEDGSRLTPL